jgi:hypothetical protein
MFTSTYLSAAVGAGDADHYCETQNMKVGALTLTATLTPGTGARLVTCTRTVDGAADTPGTLVVVGKNLANQTITETIAVGAHGILVTGTKLFASITTITGAGWVIAGNNDTIIVGMAAEHFIAEGAGVLKGILITEAVASAINVMDGAKTLAIFPASMAIGYYELNVNYGGGLRVEPQGNSKISIIHTPSMPTSYAMS